MAGDEGYTLHVALQDGFDDEPVIVNADGREIYRNEHVRTDPRIGVAHAFETRVKALPEAIEVTLPRRGLTSRLQVPRGGDVHVGISVVDGVLRFRTSERPFGYV